MVGSGGVWWVARWGAVGHAAIGIREFVDFPVKWLVSFFSALFVEFGSSAANGFSAETVVFVMNTILYGFFGGAFYFLLGFLLGWLLERAGLRRDRGADSPAAHPSP